MKYKEIQRCYKKRFNKTIKTCWIADVKRQLGFPVKKAHNRKTATIINQCQRHLIAPIAQIISEERKC